MTQRYCDYSTGSDSTGNGTFGAPYKTLNRIIFNGGSPAVAAGDVVNVRGVADNGSQIVYPECPYVGVTGTAAAGILIRAYKVVGGVAVALDGTNQGPLFQVDSGISNGGLFEIDYSYMTIRNCFIASTQAKPGFLINGGSNVKLIDCGANMTAGIAVWLSGGNHNLVDGFLVSAGGVSDASAAIYVQGVNSGTIRCVIFAGVNARATAAISVFNATRPVIEECVFNSLAADCVLWYGPYGLSINRCTAHTITGHFLNAGAAADLSSVEMVYNLLSGVSGMAIKSTAGTNVWPGRVAHNIAYSVNGHSDAWANMISANVLDNAEDTVLANPFGTYPALSAAAKDHAILLPDGTYSYPDLGAVQAQASGGISRARLVGGE